MATDAKPHQATVEDYFSDDGRGNGVRIEAFTPDPSPGKANVRTKRSNPEELGLDKTPTGRVPSNSDVKSDSGYSSQSVAGMSSADSAASAMSSQRSQPVVPAPAAPAAPAVPAAPSPTPAQRAPRPPQPRQQSTQSIPSAQPAARQPLSRRDSQASRRPPTADRRPTITQPTPKRRDSRNLDDCTVPGCTKCGPDAIEARPRQPRRPSMLHTQPAESAPDVSYPHPYDTRSQLSDPAQYQNASSRENRAPRTYHAQGGPVVQPAISRRLSVNARRPTSYHGDIPYNWPQPGMHASHPSPPQEHGPPLSRSAVYGNMPYGQPPMPSPHMQPYPNPNPNPPPQAFYQAQQMQPVYDQQRPPLQARASASSGYGYPTTPVLQVERTDRHMPSARYHTNPPPPPTSVQRQQPRRDYRNQEEYDDSESESESETGSEEEYEPEYPPQRPRMIMAPPDSQSQRGASKRRPSLRHANTMPAPPAPEPRRPQTVIVPERHDPRVRHRRDSRADRRASVSRPPLIPPVKSHSAYDSPQARIIVEGSRSSRRESLQAYDGTFQEHRTRQQKYNEPRRPDRSSRVYENVAVGHDYERDFDDDEEEDEPVARAPLRRHETGTESRRRHQRPVEVRQAADAEDYISAKRGDRETYADQTYEMAKKRSSRTSGGPSEAESSRSKGSDNGGEIRLRIGNDAPVTLSLNGDMEGRTLQLVPIENGMNELVISGNARGGESTYRSERGSTRGDRRAIMPASQPRREAEEMTERSSQSSRRKRESRVDPSEPRRLLQRQPRRTERREPEYRY
ncbi:uncharacterized protein EKO05_0000200 [Ascochyta rabiei]|uniref:Uncharacterized protein n=1 Tax=Didymella rabiei TaxID=5454 RepID=A0A163M134_DIDRA|nr:uncharacterized protein EKO05_0000200 [Ascochyta rabiei]KZM28303.1 hypothetical protein ST47_g554 [Ascochyta rabiei]UPX09511.1 hypothetical protein EKO05_0000200 [Ascochyta rabiei]